jgi:hypothetical protein
MESHLSERRYSDDEVGLILRKATEAGLPGPVARSDGLTLDELKGIAREVGISPGAIEAAARHIDLARPRGGGFMGRSVTPRYEAVVPGEIDVTRLSDAMAAVRRATGRQGIVKTEFGGLEWQARDAFGGRYVSLQPQDRKTHIRVFGNFRDGAIMSAVGGLPPGVLMAAVGAGIMKTIGLAAFAAAGALPAGFIAGALSARLVWKRFLRRETEALQRAAGDLETALTGSHGQAGERLLPDGNDTEGTAS